MKVDHDLIRNRFEQATVKLPRVDGQGVYVGDGLILTAAHCLDFHTGGDMTLSPKLYQETVRTHYGREFKVGVYAVEPFSDIAVLGKTMVEEDEENMSLFEAFCEAATPLEICPETFFEKRESLEDGKFGVHIYTHENEIKSGQAIMCRRDIETLFLKEVTIEGGTSGGPIINDACELVAIVSNGEMHQPIPCRALPVWAMKRLSPKPTSESAD